MLSCHKQCADASQGLFLGDGEGGWPSAPRRGVLVSVCTPSTLSTRPQRDIRHSPCFPGGSLWPRGAERLTEVTQQICRGTWCGDEGHREGGGGTSPDGFVRPRPRPPPRPPGRPVWVGWEVLGPLSRPQLTPSPSRAGGGLRDVSEPRLGSLWLRVDCSHFRSLCPLAFHVRSSPGLPDPTHPGPRGRRTAPASAALANWGEKEADCLAGGRAGVGG